jgi:hypothetical protein
MLFLLGCLHHRDLSSRWTCLHYRVLFCTWTGFPLQDPELHLAVSGQQEPVLHSDLSTHWGLSFTRTCVCTTKSCAALEPVYTLGPGLQQDVSAIQSTGTVLHSDLSTHRGLSITRLLCHQYFRNVINSETKTNECIDNRIERLTANAVVATVQLSWVQSQHPPTQRNLRGGRLSSVKYRTVHKKKKIQKIPL